jgi:prevent-host-death family protein
MNIKRIASTEAQNNFGRVLDDVVQRNTRYVVYRRQTAQAIILSIADFEHLLAADATERNRLEKLIRELSPVYALGTSIEGGTA